MRAMMLMQPAAARGAPAGWLGWDGWSEAGWLGPLAAMAVLLTLATVVHALVFGLLRRAERKRRTLADVHLLRKVPDSLIMRLDKGRLSDPTGALKYPPKREPAPR